MKTSHHRSRRLPAPPSGFDDHLSRREAAHALGFGSEFKVRQLEKEGHLHPVRGAMGQAWYPRAEVLALIPGSAGADSVSTDVRSARPAAAGRWTDAALIAHLREPATSGGDTAPRPRTVVDLVADAGVSIARAERVYRFWLAHDLHSVAQGLRQARGQGAGDSSRRVTGAAPSSPTSTSAGTDSRPGPTSGGTLGAPLGANAGPGERRGGDRMERDTLIRQLRDADPSIRARAFQTLKTRHKPG